MSLNWTPSEGKGFFFFFFFFFGGSMLSWGSGFLGGATMFAIVSFRSVINDC